jgi:hypothetical protein
MAPALEERDDPPASELAFVEELGPSALVLLEGSEGGAESDGVRVT